MGDQGIIGTVDDIHSLDFSFLVFSEDIRTSSEVGVTINRNASMKDSKASW